MRISTELALVNSVYHAQIGIDQFTELEKLAIAEFGEPTINTGGDFAGTVTRPGQVNTTLTIAPPGSGTTATATPVIDGFGAITGATITGGGSGYSSDPAVSAGGDGSGATFQATQTSGVVTAIAILAGGSGYHATPVNVSFSLPSAVRRLRTDLPVRQAFDLRDYADADARAKVWLDTMTARIIASKQILLSYSAPFVISNMTTI